MKLWELISWTIPKTCFSFRSGGGSGGFKQQQALEQEKNLPAVIMAQDRQVFDILYQLVNFEELTVTARVRELLLLIPSDSGVIEILDNLANAINATSSAVSSKSNSLDRKFLKSAGESSSISEKLAAFASSSPKLKQKTPEKELEKKKEAAEILKPLLDITSAGLNPFKLLYNIEVGKKVFFFKNRLFYVAKFFLAFFC